MLVTILSPPPPRDEWANDSSSFVCRIRCKPRPWDAEMVGGRAGRGVGGGGGEGGVIFKRGRCIEVDSFR